MHAASPIPVRALAALTPWLQDGAGRTVACRCQKNMQVIVLQSRHKELILTVVLPALFALLQGLALESLVLLRIWRPWIETGSGLNSSLGRGLMVVLPNLVLFCSLQYFHSYRLGYGLLGAGALAFAFSCPAGLDLTIGDSTWDLIDIGGLVFTCGPLMLLALTCTCLVYALRLCLQGRTTLWHEGICVGCGYSLVGNLSGTCPECGKKQTA